jgi:hypothetical protein
MLKGEVLPVRGLAEDFIDDLYALHAAHYDNTHPDQFRADMAEKEWVIVLREPASGAAVGFSTQMLLDIRVEGIPVRALFSGDTIIHRDHWGSQELVRTWCRFAGTIKARCIERPLYWFLISKGYRTYLYLPFFFHAFYPRHDRPTPAFAQRLIDSLGAKKYPDSFDPRTGLIQHARIHDRVKENLDATDRHRRSPHVAFFVRRNQDYAQGSELVCVAEIAPENMRGVARTELEIGIRAADGGAV